MARKKYGRAALAAALLATSLSLVTAAPAAAGHVPWIDTSDRAAVLAAYNTEFDRTEPDSGYTGAVETCTPGTTSQEFRDSVVQRLNWYRRMAGLGIVNERAAYSTATQQSSTMMSAQGTLSHAPDGTWSCYTVVGATAAASSNLALGVNGIGAIDAYIRDSGDNNTAVGHRRTILYPQLLEVGTGDVEAGSGHFASNSLRVFDDNLWGNRPGVREVRGFVAWPPPGYVPPETVWGRWSFSLGGADFSVATVSVSDRLGAIQVDVIDRIQTTTPGSQMAPEASIVWAVGGDTSSTALPFPTDGDECYDVTIAGVKVSGIAQAPYNYTTCVIDPDSGTTKDGTADGDTDGGKPGSCEAITFGAWTAPCWQSGGTLGGFTDVFTPWQREPVAFLVVNGITTGVSPDHFEPDGALTRAQAATMIWRLAGSPTAPADSPRFSDVLPGAWYEEAVRWMARYGITTGTGGGNFSPGAPATRAEFVTFLWRLVDKPRVGGAMPFVDLTQKWQDGAVRWAVNTNVTTGITNTLFGPEQWVTRGQAAAFLARFAGTLS